MTLCVPTIGRLEFLSRVKASIAAQTFGAFEVLVLDNASPREVRADLDAWASEDPRVRVLRVEERVPMWDNFNRGVLGARGEYVAFCHDDDELEPRFLERNLAFMDRHRDVGFVGCNHYDIGPDGEVIALRQRIARSEVLPGARFIEGIVRTGRTALAMQTIFFRRAVFPEGGFDPTVSRFFGDFVLLMRMAETWKVGTIAEALVRVRIHPGQASAWPLSEIVPYRTKILLAYCAELRGRRASLDVDRYEREVRRVHLLHLGWAWVSASREEDARSSSREIAAALPPALGAASGRLMGALEGTGARRLLRRAAELASANAVVTRLRGWRGRA